MRKIIEQFDLREFLELFLFGNLAEKKENYLKRDERITNMMRTRYEEKIKALQVCTLEEKIFSKDIKSYDDWMKHIAKSVRPFFVDLNDLNQKLAELFHFCDTRIWFEKFENPPSQYSYEGRRVGGDVLLGHIMEGKNETLTFCTFSVRWKDKPYYFLNIMPGMAGDAGLTIASLYMFCAAKESIRKENKVILSTHKKGDTLKILEGVSNHIRDFLAAKGFDLQISSYGDNGSRYMWPFLNETDISYADIHYSRARKGGIFVWPFTNGYGGSFAIISEAFNEYAESKINIMREKEYLDDLERAASESRAKPYELKKNIPQKILESMEKSMLNQFFGFVEYDESVDIEKAVEIEKEFSALREKYFSKVDSKEIAVRFRKLGNYHALGLFYPFIGCLCVDVRSPESMVHEYGHLIDYGKERKNMSLEPKFAHILKMYELHLNNEMDKDKGFKAMMSKGKYSKKYYLTPTEVFARSFELYVSIILGVKNSLVPLEFDSRIYPYEDKKFMTAIEEYFDEQFEIKRKEERNYAESV